MAGEQWIGVALIVTALAVAMLAIAGFCLGAVLSRVADALEALRPPVATGRSEAGQRGGLRDVPPPLQTRSSPRRL